MSHTFILWIFISGVFACIVSASQWSTWSRWSECSRTCDGGARYKTRKCSLEEGQRSHCPGQEIEYSTCNTQSCPRHVLDFRSGQCAAYNDASYSGYNFRWVPSYEDKNPCALTCLAEGTNMVAILAPKVLDGTRCREGSMDMCINGRCVAVGCDYRLYSKLKSDACGVCGGDNSTCGRARAMTSRRHTWIQTDYGPCSVTCGVGVKDKRLLCFDTHDSRVVDAHACAHVDMPTDTRASCSQGICPSDWRVGPWQNCTRDCGGGISWRIVTCVKTNEDDTQILVRDSECDENKRPSSRKSCNGLMCPTWHAGEWSVCSVSCGKGVQRREVVCRHVGDVFCHEVEKPRTVKTCTTGVPCYDLAGDIQERKVGEFGGGDGIQGDQAITKEDLYTPRFVTTTWDSCSATCGEGVHFRYVRCQVFLRYLDDYVDLPDEDCSDEAKPAEKEVCMVEPCYDQYHWVPVGMTACSHTCLGGIQETIFACMSKVNQMTVADSFCAEAPHVQVERRVCNDRPCPQRWDLGAFGSCSKSCGGGVKSRAVKCIQEYAQNSVLNLPDFMCAQPGPPFTTYCNDMDCPAHWTVGNWSMCSVTCGIGVQMRIPLCQRVQNSSLVNVSLSDCDVTVKPLTEMSCNLTACPQPKIKVNKLKLFQLNKIRTIRLSAGMEGHILPDTNIVIKCPNVGLDRQKVTWFKNGLKFRRSKRAKVARSGALRIRQAYPGRDDAVYSCLIGGLEANVTISFISSFELLQAKILREKYLNGKEDNHNVLNKTVYYKDPIDRKRKPLTLISTEWSRCSVTCGGGLQSRNISCELISSRYYAALPKEECFRHSAVSPALIQSCNVDPCVEWQTGNWSECSDLDCVRYEYSIQRRSVDCVNLFNDTVTNSSWCTGLGFPPDSIRDCFNRNCSVKWLTSKWSECIADCGEKGIRVRSYKCVWSGSELPATFGSCDVIARPATTRTCKAKPCEDLECRDESENCPLVAQTALCDYPAYKRTCCKSCRNQSDIDNDTEEAKT